MKFKIISVVLLLLVLGVLFLVTSEPETQAPPAQTQTVEPGIQPLNIN